jgi:hypothetical protein
VLDGDCLSTVLPDEANVYVPTDDVLDRLGDAYDHSYLAEPEPDAR